MTEQIQGSIGTRTCHRLVSVNVIDANASCYVTHRGNVNESANDVIDAMESYQVVSSVLTCNTVCSIHCLHGFSVSYIFPSNPPLQHQDSTANPILVGKHPHNVQLRAILRPTRSVRATRPSIRRHAIARPRKHGSAQLLVRQRAADGPYGADQSRMRTRPDGYYPFQSILEPDGRYAYSDGAARYPQFYGSSYAPSQDWFMSTKFPFGLPIDLPFEMHMR